MVARLRPTKPSPNVPWIRDRRREGFRGFPGKNGENGGTRSTNHGFSKSIRFFLGKLIKRQRWNLIALDMMIPLRLKKTFDIGIQSSNLGICRESR